MTTEQDGNSSSPSPAESLTRRMALKVAGLVWILRGTPSPIAGPARAADGTQGARSTDQATIVAAEQTATVDDRIGRHAQAVALDGQTAIIGVPPPATKPEPSVGRAAVFTRSGGSWTGRATLSAGGESGQFGRAVGLDGDTAVVGGELGPDSRRGHGGRATVFSREAGAWSRTATLGSSGSDGVDLFGTAVDVAGGTVVVGASAATPDGERRSGAAFVFSRSGGSWRQTARLTPRADRTMEFGRAVASTGDTAIVGARRSGRQPADSGTAVVFRRDGGRWRRQSELTPPGRDRDDGFGSVLAMADDTVVVGAPTETNAIGTNAGAAYVFVRRNGRWQRQATLRDETGAANHQFGSALAIDGETILIGTEFGGGPYVFTRAGDTWTRATALGPDEGDSPVNGTMVALDGTRAFVGTNRRQSSPNRTAGSVEVFEP